MNAIWGLLGVVVLALLLSAGALSELDDTATLVPAPESEVKGFMEKLVHGRYLVAPNHLSEELSKDIDAAHLRRAMEALRARIGSIEEVESEPAGIIDRSAAATAMLITEADDTVSLRFPLAREHGLWKITSVESLEEAQ